MNYATGGKLTGFAAGTEDLMETQASVFEDTCNVWCPRYNQVGMLSLGVPSPTASKEKLAAFKEHIDLSIKDLADAFMNFLAERVDKTRPFFIFGHSQGSIIMTKVIKDCLVGHDQAGCFVAAYLAGGYIPLDIIPVLGGDLHVSTGPEDTNCIMSWDSRTTDVWKPEALNEGSLALWPHSLYWVVFDKYCDEPKDPDPKSKHRVQVSPLSWCAEPGGEYFGAHHYEQKEPEMPTDAAAWAQAVKPDTHCLWVMQPAKKKGGFMENAGPAAGEGNLHPADVTLWYYNIKQNIPQRLAAWKKTHAKASDVVVSAP
jgi:hypothetical protein